MSNIRKFLYGDKSSLELPAQIDSCSILSEWISSISRQLSIEDKLEKKLLIAVDEIFSNIVKYANVALDSIVKVEISFDTEEKILELKFIDKGIAYNPLEAAAPDISASLEERGIGGLGIFLVKKIMDKVDYKRENDSNILSLKKSIIKS